LGQEVLYEALWLTSH